MAVIAKRLFTSKQDWIVGLAKRAVEEFNQKPTLVKLEKFVSTDLEFRQAVKTKNIKRWNLKRVLGHRSIASAQWELPSLENVSELCQWLKLSRNDLDWLANFDVNSAPRKFDRSQHYVCTWIKKRSCGYRLIESPKSLLKEVQRQILNGLIAKVPTHDAAHGFCFARNAVTFVEPHVSKKFCLKMDLKDFFPSIQFGRVWGLFRSVGYDRDVARYLAAICTHAVCEKTIEDGIHIRGRSSNEAKNLYTRRHLPQGAPTSPALANLVAFRLDSRLTGLANQIAKTNPNSDVAFTRYADDLLMSANDCSVTSKRFATTIGAIAIEEGFQIQFRKTRLMPESQRQHATGIVINETTNLARSEFDRLKAILHNCVKLGISSQNRDGHPNFRQHLLGRIGWVRQLNQTKAAKLQALFDLIQR